MVSTVHKALLGVKYENVPKKRIEQILTILLGQIYKSFDDPFGLVSRNIIQFTLFIKTIHLS